MYKAGLVSCIIPTYKRSDSLLRAVNSVLNQSYDNIEVLVVDDNIPGDEYSAQVKNKLNDINDGRVKYVGQKKHINGAAARNAGINAASGEFIAFLDDDDEWLEEKTAIQVDMLNNNPSIGGASCLYELKKGDTTFRRCPGYTGENMQYKVFSREVSVFTSTVMVRASAISDIRFDEKLLRHQDLQFLVQFLAHNKLKPINDYLVYLHTDSDINKPDLQSFINAKERFFVSTADEMKKYTQKEQKDILSAHYFEVIKMAASKGKFITVLKYLMKIGLNLNAYKKVLRRYRQR